jgi:hypothetical protein
MRNMDSWRNSVAGAKNGGQWMGNSSTDTTRASTPGARPVGKRTEGTEPKEERNTKMNDRRAKQIRKFVYGEMSFREYDEKKYVWSTRRKGLFNMGYPLFGTLSLSSLRKQYQLAKEAFRDGALFKRAA